MHIVAQAENVFRLDVPMNQIKPQQLLRSRAKEGAKGNRHIRGQPLRLKHRGQGGPIYEFHYIIARGLLQRFMSVHEVIGVQPRGIPRLACEGIEMFLAADRFRGRKLQHHALAVFFREPDPVGILEGPDELITIQHLTFLQGLGNGERAFVHGAKFSGLCNVEDNGAHVIQGFRGGQQARGLHNAARGAALGQGLGDGRRIELVGNTIGAEQGDIAVFELCFKKMRLDHLTHAKGAGEHILPGLFDVIFREHFHTPRAAKANLGVAQIHAIEPVTLNDGGRERGDHLGSVEARKGLLVKGAVQQRREFRQSPSRWPRTRTRFIVFHQRTHRALGGFACRLATAGAIGQDRKDGLTPRLHGEGIRRGRTLCASHAESRGVDFHQLRSKGLRVRCGPR